jgi:hypothetical protein
MENQTNIVSQSVIAPKVKQLSVRIRIGMFINSRMFDYLIIFLVAVYTALVFINFSFTSE